MLYVDSEKQQQDQELRKYKFLGHTGYILDYRTRNGCDPNPSILQSLAKKSDHERFGLFACVVKGIIDTLT